MKKTNICSKNVEEFIIKFLKWHHLLQSFIKVSFNYRGYAYIDLVINEEKTELCVLYDNSTDTVTMLKYTGEDIELTNENYKKLFNEFEPINNIYKKIIKQYENYR